MVWFKRSLPQNYQKLDSTTSRKPFLSQNQLKTHKNTWHNHSAITFTYFVKTNKFQKEKCRESCHEQLSFTTYKQKTNGSRVRGARNSRFHKEKRKSLRAFSSSSSTNVALMKRNNIGSPMALQLQLPLPPMGELDLIIKV